ncbi:hypothetical protein ACMYR3_10605 [Ampullimonas aquatilis]|uniref:hypothetical protein n=1 Tax=Ampullimonas aquatilis TaxID=1341549 RepID=UPI003C75E575
MPETSLQTPYNGLNALLFGASVLGAIPMVLGEMGITIKRHVSDAVDALSHIQSQLPDRLTEKIDLLILFSDSLPGPIIEQLGKLAQQFGLRCICCRATATNVKLRLQLALPACERCVQPCASTTNSSGRTASAVADQTHPTTIRSLKDVTDQVLWLQSKHTTNTPCTANQTIPKMIREQFLSISQTYFFDLK